MGALGDIRAIVFDLDGTLVDSLDDIAWNLNAALADSGLLVHSLAEVRSWVGRGARALVASAINDPARVDEVLARFQVHYRAAPYARTHVYPGLPGALDELVARGLLLAVLSNKPHSLVVEISAHLLARWPFTAIAGERPDRPHKPDPEAVLAVARSLGVPPARCAVVGDSEIDIATARAAGIPSVAVTWGLGDPEALAAAHPDHVVTTPSELAALFGDY